jgi:hypothetical protein
MKSRTILGKEWVHLLVINSLHFISFSKSSFSKCTACISCYPSVAHFSLDLSQFCFPLGVQFAVLVGFHSNDYSTVIWDVALCCLVEIYWGFRGQYCLHLQDQRVCCYSKKSVCWHGLLFDPEDKWYLLSILLELNYNMIFTHYLVFEKNSSSIIYV